MNGQMMSFKEKNTIVDNFISRINPYEKPHPLKFDLRGYSKYVTENNLSADEITDKIMEKFNLHNHKNSSFARKEGEKYVRKEGEKCV